MVIVLAAIGFDAGTSWLVETAGLRGLWIGLNLLGAAILVLRLIPQKPNRWGQPSDRR